MNDYCHSVEWLNTELLKSYEKVAHIQLNSRWVSEIVFFTYCKIYFYIHKYRELRIWSKIQTYDDDQRERNDHCCSESELLMTK